MDFTLPKNAKFYLNLRKIGEVVQELGIIHEKSPKTSPIPPKKKFKPEDNDESSKSLPPSLKKNFEPGDNPLLDLTQRLLKITARWNCTFAEAMELVVSFSEAQSQKNLREDVDIIKQYTKEIKECYDAEKI